MTLPELPQRYLYLDELAKVGGGRTILALDQDSGEEVAIQVGPPEGAALSLALLAQARELHDSAAPTLRAFYSGPPSLAVFPWVGGYPLLEALVDGLLPLNEGLVLCCELVRKVAQLHAQGLTHGDLHPRNVLIGRGGRMTLVGMRLFPAPLPVATARTRCYAAPETRRTGRVALAGDLYSLGLLLFEILAGKPLVPKGDADALEALQPEVLAAVRCLPELRPRLPRWVLQVLQTMLDPDPSQRPRSAVIVLRLFKEQLTDDEAYFRRYQRLRRRLRQLRRQLQVNLAGGLPASTTWRPLGLASCLRRLAELGPIEDRYSYERYEAAMRRVLWHVLVPPAPGIPIDEARSILLLLYRAAGATEDQWLQAQARALLEAASRTPGNLAPFLKSSALETVPPRPRDSLRRSLLRNPFDGDAALEYAIQVPPVPGMPAGATQPERVAAYFEATGLPAVAVATLATGLVEFPQNVGYLSSLARLSTAAAGDAAGFAPSETNPGLGRVSAAEPSSLLDELRAGTHSLPPPRQDPEEDDLDEPPDELQSSIFEDASVIFSEGMIRAREGRYLEALESFQEVLTLGELQRTRFHAPLCSELRNVVWSTVLASASGLGESDVLAQALPLCDALSLAELANAVEMLWVAGRSGSDSDRALAALLRTRPRSPVLLRARLEQAKARGEAKVMSETMGLLSHALLARGQLTAASRLALEAQALTPGHDDPSLSLLVHGGAGVAGTAAEFRQVETDLSGATSPEEEFEISARFLRDHPYYEPGLERMLRTCQQLGDAHAVARFSLDLARVQLDRGEPGRARLHLRDVLQAIPGRDEALLWLLGSVGALAVRCKDPTLLKVRLLEREGLHDAAAQLARRSVDLGATDPALQVLAASAEGLAAQG